MLEVTQLKSCTSGLKTRAVVPTCVSFAYWATTLKIDFGRKRWHLLLDALVVHLVPSTRIEVFAE